MSLFESFRGRVPRGPDFRNLEKETVKNDEYRKVLYTIPGKFQLVLMSLKPKEAIAEEVHSQTTQFIRVEKGTATVTIGQKKFTLKDGFSVVVPPGMKHKVENLSSKKVKLYTIYTPPEHPAEKVGQQCVQCNFRLAEYQCGACSNAAYCSEYCQQAHWKIVHKNQCQQKIGSVVYEILEEGTLIDDGRYELVRRLGDPYKTMSQVYEALDLSTKKRVVMKFFDARFENDKERFISEVYIQRALSQSDAYLCRCTARCGVRSFLEKDLAILVSSMAEKDSECGIFRTIDLAEFIDDMPFLFVDEKDRTPTVLNMAADIVEDVSTFHSFGIVHRDLKPENMLMDICFKKEDATQINSINNVLFDFDTARIFAQKNLYKLVSPRQEKGQLQGVWPLLSEHDKKRVESGYLPEFLDVDGSYLVGTPLFIDPDYLDYDLTSEKDWKQMDIFALGVTLFLLESGTTIDLPPSSQYDLDWRPPSKENLLLDSVIQSMTGPVEQRKSAADYKKQICNITSRYIYKILH